MSKTDEFREKRAEREAGDEQRAERNPERRGDVRLQSPSGVVIDHSLPLHPAIYDQWRKGELSRVDDGGQPWAEGDEYDLDSAWERRGREGNAPERRDDEAADDEAGTGREDGEAGGGDIGYDGQENDLAAAGTGDTGTPEPVRPADNAPKKAWQDYAVAVGAVPEAEAPGLSRQQLIDRSTPPELRPGVQP